MKKFLLFLLLLNFFLVKLSFSQINISVGNTLIENFAIGTSATASLPANWKVDKNTTVRTLGTYASAVSATEQRAGENMSSTAANGIYNYSTLNPTTSTERAVGFISSSSATKSGNLYVYLNNNGASSITSFTISYNVEKYRLGTNAAGFSIQMYYSTDGSSWTSAGSSFLNSFAGGDATNSGFTPVPSPTQSVSAQSLTVTVAAGSNLYLAWNYSVTSGTTTSNAQALGIDDVQITANGASCTTPSSQATNITFANVGATQMDVSWTSGNGSKRIVKMNTTNSFTAPTDGTDPTANSLYSGSGQQVVYNNSGNSLTVTGLSASTTYYYRVYEYNCTGTSTKFYTVTATNNPNSQATTASCSAPTTQASNISFSAMAANQMDVSWSSGNGSKRIVKMNTTNSFTAPTDGTDPTANSLYSGSGEQVVYNNSGNSLTVTGLSASTTYYYRVYEYNCTGASTKFYTVSATNNPNSQATTASTSLGAGAISFLDMNADVDAFSFIAMVNISANEKIYFTDNGWKSDNTWNNTEGVLTWNAPAGGVACGTIVQITNNTTASVGTLNTDVSFILSTSGDQIIAYQNGNVMLAAINCSGAAVWQTGAINANTSNLPLGLTNGTNAVAINELDNIKYNIATLSDARSNVLSSINNSSNWVGDNSTAQTYSGTITICECGGCLPTIFVSPSSLTGFSYYVGSGPSASQPYTLSASTLSPAAGNITVSAPTDFEVSIDNINFATSKTVAYTGSALANTTIYVRLKSGLTSGNYTTENVTNAGGSATTKNVVCSGAVYALPSVVLSSNNPAVNTGNISQNTNGELVYELQLDVTGNSTTLGSLTFSTSGTYLSTDIFNFKLLYASTNALASATPIGSTITTGLGAGSHTFTSLLQDLSVGTHYFWITTDVQCNAILNNTLAVSALAVSDLVFNLGTKSGSAFAGGIKTISSSAIVSNIGSYNSNSGNAKVTLNWANPSCFDEILIVAKSTNVVSFTPSGDGSSYAANTVFGLGTMVATGTWAVYKGTSNTIVITSLTNGTTYYFKAFTRIGNVWSSGTYISVTPNQSTVLFPGDMIIVGYDANVNTGDDKYYLATFVDLIPGTTIKLVNSRFETGAAANVRTNQWGGAGDDPYQDPGFVDITWNGPGNIFAGSIISFQVGSTISNVEIDGLNSTGFDFFNAGNCNISTSASDQIFLVQGSFTSYGIAGVDRYNLLNGQVLFGLTNRASWVALSSSVSSATTGAAGTRVSRLPGDLECFNMEYPAAEGFAYYLNSALHTGSKKELLNQVMNSGNWSTGAGDGTLNFTEDFSSPYTGTAIGKPFIINLETAGSWDGSISSDWFDCKNWKSLAVPDENTDVVITGIPLNKPKIDVATSTKEEKFGGLAKVKNIEIRESEVILEGSPNNILEIYGDISITNSGQLDISDGITGTPDGQLFLHGKWYNFLSESAFKQGESRIVLKGANPQSFFNFATGYEVINDLDISISSQLLISANQKLMVVGNIGNLNGNSGILIQSNATSTGALIHNNAGVNATCQRYNTGASWHYLSSPIHNLNKTYLTGGINPNFYYYNETIADQWDALGTYAGGISGWATVPITLTNGKGYSLYHTFNQTYNMQGALNNGDISIPVSLTNTAAPDEYDGWNLIGNPYPSPMDWDNANIVKTNVDNAIYYWNGTNYVCHVGTGGNNLSPSPIAVNIPTNGNLIPVNQAFMVKCNHTAGGSVTFKNAARTFSTQNFYRSSNADKLKMKISSENFSDEAVLRFYEFATQNFDSQYDGYKFFTSNQKVPQVYLIANDHSKLSIQTLSKIDFYEIPIGIRLPKSGMFTLEFIENTIPDNNLLLYDAVTGDYTPIVGNNGYTFVSNSGVISNRFKLVLGNMTENKEKISNLSISTDNGEINILSNSFLSDVHVFDISGKLIFVEKEYNTNFNISVKPGIYFVRLFSENQFVNKKIVVY